MCTRKKIHSYCVADCRVLNEGKLVGCQMVMHGQMKYHLGGTIFPISSLSTETVVLALKCQCVGGFEVVQITVPKGDFIFRLVASGYRDNQDKTSLKFCIDFVRTFELL